MWFTGKIINEYFKKLNNENNRYKIIYEFNI